MKAILLAVIFLASTMTVAQEQPKPYSDACNFIVSQDSTVPSITGPENLTPLAYVVHEPDSPIEIVSVDLEGMWLSVSGSRYAAYHSVKYQARNRSNKAIRFVDIRLLANGRSGLGATNGVPISPGQTVELKINGGSSAARQRTA